MKSSSFMIGSLLLLSQKLPAAIKKTHSGFALPSNTPVVVAVIDTGLDTRHRAFKNLLWENKGESGVDSEGRDKSNNGIDDDDNGFVDDFHGWNFVKNNHDLADSLGHGTHISGVIKNESARSTSLEINSQLPSSTLPNPVRLMILKYYDPEATDSQNIDNTVKAIKYAVKMGARVINYSGGGSLPYSLELKALKEAEEKGIWVVAAAGNNKSNTDIQNYFPANYGLTNIISVAATDSKGELVSFSNYGANTVDIGAPGQNIVSTLPDNKYGVMSGTSQATAFVTGRLAALLVNSGTKTMTQVKQILFKSGHPSPSLAGKTKSRVAFQSSENL